MADENDPRVPTGIAGLDDLLRGGLPQGHLYLLTGPSGAGKTTMALQFLLEGARRGERVLYLGTAETEEEIDAVARSHGWDMAGLTIRHYGGPAEPLHGPEQTMFHPAEVELPRTMEKLMALVKEVRPQRLVIDSLSEIRLLAREDDWFREQIKILQRDVAKLDCTVVVTDLFVQDQPVLRSGVHGVIELNQLTAVYGPDRRQLRVVKVRGSGHATGYHDFAIEKGGVKVFPRLVAAEHGHQHTYDSISSGLPELDAMLGGGIDRGTATLFLGPTGTGKSTLVTHYIVAAARRGEKSTMYLFDERRQTLLTRSRDLKLELEEHIEAGLVEVRQVNPVELTPGQFSQAVVDAVEGGSQIIAVDSLNGYAYAMPEERLLGLYLHELLSYLNQKGVTSLLVMAQHGMLAPTPMEFDISYIADTVILLRPFEYAGKVRKALSVHKRRSGDHEKSIREFHLSGDGIVVGPPLEQFSGVIAGNLQFLGNDLTRPDAQ